MQVFEVDTAMYPVSQRKHTEEADEVEDTIQWEVVLPKKHAFPSFEMVYVLSRQCKQTSEICECFKQFVAVMWVQVVSVKSR